MPNLENGGNVSETVALPGPIFAATLTPSLLRPALADRSESLAVFNLCEPWLVSVVGVF